MVFPSHASADLPSKTIAKAVRTGKFRVGREAPHPEFPQQTGDRYDSSHSRSLDLFLFLEIFEREGGIQSYVQELLHSYLVWSRLKNCSADIFLLRDQVGENPFQSEHLQFRYFKTRFSLLSRVRLAIALCLHLLYHRPQRVFCGHVHLAPLVWLLCKPLGIPYIVMTHGKEVWEPLPQLSQIALRQADQIWTVSRYSRDQAAASNRLDRAKIQLLPCPVDGDRFRLGDKSPALVEKYQLANATVILTVARLWSGDIYKGVDVTIRALPAIAQAFPNVKYLVIGRGDDQPRLAKLAIDLGMGDRVIFAGFVPTVDLADHYRLADAYVMPSQEGFGIVYLEAMACGIPVMSGDADGSADPLQDGKLGWHVPHRDPAAVAAACVEMLQAQEKGDRRGEGDWLRSQTLQHFGQAAFRQRLQHLLSF
ncbi:MAG: glycosyltransferase [Drouetiella hepatica Uher 2000/2452]|jgi:glycosyltransferase involved in cell wall biosynthesis|uniref:Glycosyltransferase n=1 Tax=Drouetiella hepatica Uher 2000/2452 TaxID=904376 RepID=A0A951UPF9_9CYAN|nr:glycosyltransferase [Drouetiella hepatica Uher 2000/2452]